MNNLIVGDGKAMSDATSFQTSLVLDRRGRQVDNFLLQMLKSLHEELRAYLFLFIEIGCVGNCAAGCHDLHACLWMDIGFWKIYAGPYVFSTLPIASDCAVTDFRECFRKWIFHLDGPWTKDLLDVYEEAEQAEFGADYTQLFSHARYIASGLMPQDNQLAVAEFVGLVCQLLWNYDATQLDERSEAEAITVEMERRPDVFTGPQIKEVTAAFDSSIGRAILEQPMDEDVVDIGHNTFLDTLALEDEEMMLYPTATNWSSSWEAFDSLDDNGM